MRGLRNRIRCLALRLRDDTSGLALTELALVVPILSLLTIGTVDYSMMVIASLTVQGAARSGAEYAVAQGYNATTISNRITSTTTRTGILSAISANPAPSQWYGCPNATTGVTTAVTSTTVCSTGKTAGTYVTSNAQATYTYMLPWPYVPSSQTLNASVTVRIN